MAVLLRLLGPQGIAGIAVALCLAALLAIQKGETRHWRKQASEFEQLYRGEQAAFAGTVANYRAAAEAARAADRAAARRVEAAQENINQRSNHVLETRLADARARAQRLRFEATSPAADPGSGGDAPMPRLSIAPTGADQTAAENRLPPEDALTATEQAIQLDELILWVRRQAEVDNGGADGAKSGQQPR